MLSRMKWASDVFARREQGLVSCQVDNHDSSTDFLVEEELNESAVSDVDEK